MTIAIPFAALLVSGAALCYSTNALAALAADAQRGEKLVEHPVPGRKSEVCVIPKHFPNAVYSDADLKAEGQLCDIDENSNAAVCPKTNSTNPGLDFYSLAQGSTSKGIVSVNCKKPGAKKIAKYKLSTSCSYTPSILGYYHVAGMLGGIANVPPAVLRTFDLQNHIALGRFALGETVQSALIHQTWASLMAQLTAGARASRRDLLLTDDFTQSYGALSVNPRQEQFYKDFFNGGANNIGRAANFRDKNPIMALLSRSGDISAAVGRTFNVENVQKMVQLRDAANLIVIDTLMNQQDRFGNIHYIESYYYLDSKDANSDGTPKLKWKPKLKSDQAPPANSLVIKEMMLKDNDCGVAKQNLAKQAGLARRLGHIDPATYYRILQFDAIADSPSTKQFFTEELLFTSRDYVSVRGNLRELAANLHQACLQGKLKLDLDLPAHFSSVPLKPRRCEL